MKRLFASPLLSASLAALWLLLNDARSPGHWLIAVLLALLLPHLSAPLRPQRGQVGRLRVLARLILAVGQDVILSALQVARGVLAGPRHAPNGVFLRIPLQLRDGHGLAALAVISTSVPGTVWCELAPDRSSLLLHVFDLDDEAAFIHHFKQRYEHPLMEIFE